MFPNMNGVTAIGDLPEMNVDVDANQILKSFNLDQCYIWSFLMKSGM